MTIESQASPQDDRVQEIVNYVVNYDGSKSGDHEKLDDYLLKGYRVIDIITNITQGDNNTTSSVFITVLLSKEFNAGIYKPQ
jgi:hypothetical protein